MKHIEERPLKLRPEFEWLKEITPLNFSDKFNIDKLLLNSCFYPASGLDAKDIEHAANLSQSFVHVDYSHSKNEVRTAMENDFYHVGYDLVGISEITKEALTPEGWQQSYFQPHKYTINRPLDISSKSMELAPFALWAVFKLREDCNAKLGKIEMFSLLHIGGEACATYDALYINKKIRPRVVSLFYCGQEHGNWTDFYHPEGFFFSLLQLTGPPQFVLQSRDIRWPGYQALPFFEDYIYEHSAGHMTMFKIYRQQRDILFS